MRKKMKQMMKTVAVLALASTCVFAGTDKDMKKVVEDQGIYVETAKPGVVLSGYVDAGYTYNFNGPTVTTSGNYRDLGESLSPKGDFNINAFKLVLEKPLGDKNEFAAGFRTDLVYGEDANMFGGSSAPNLTGVNTSGASDFTLQQAFVQFRAPVGNGLDFKVGKFGSFLGFEAPERAANINITHGAVWWLQGGQHVGVQALYKFNDIIDVGFTINNGYNTADGVDSVSTINGDRYGFSGKLNVTAPGGNANIQQAFYYNPRSEQAAFTTSNGNFFLYDVWGAWKPKFANDKLLLAYNVDYGVGEYAKTVLEPLLFPSPAIFLKLLSSGMVSLCIQNISSRLFSVWLDVPNIFTAEMVRSLVLA